MLKEVYLYLYSTFGTYSEYLKNISRASSKKMPPKNGSPVYDLCIVGAGMFGCAAARHASTNPNLKVCLIGPEEPKNLAEFENREIFGAHYDEGRIVHSTDPIDAFHTLYSESMSRFSELEKLSGIQFYCPSGMLFIIDRLHEQISMPLNFNSPGNPQIVDLSCKKIFKKRYPYMKLKDNDRCYLEDKGAGYVSPRNMILAQKKVAHQQGCDIINDVVLEVKEPKNGMHEIVTEKQKHFKAKRVLLCPGAFINLKRFYPMKKLKVTLRKETAVLLRIPEEEALRLSSMPTVITYHETPESQPNLAGSYILPPIKYPDSMHYLKIGHLGTITNSELETLKDVKEWYQSEGDEDVINFCTKTLLDMLPDLKVEKICTTTCVTCDSPTGMPYIDRLTPTVTVAAVGNSRGAASCEEIGRLAAELSITGKWDTRISKFLFQAMYEKE